MGFLFWLSTTTLNKYYLNFVSIFDMHVIILYLSEPCFHYSALLPTTKVRSHSHFVYYFVIMTCLWSMIILISIDLLVNFHACFTLFSTDPFLGVRGAL